MEKNTFGDVRRFVLESIVPSELYNDNIVAYTGPVMNRLYEVEIIVQGLTGELNPKTVLNDLAQSKFTEFKSWWDGLLRQSAQKKKIL